MARIKAQVRSRSQDYSRLLKREIDLNRRVYNSYADDDPDIRSREIELSYLEMGRPREFV